MSQFRIEYSFGARVVVMPDDPTRKADGGIVVGHAFAYSEQGDPVFLYLVQLDSPCDDGVGPVHSVIGAQWHEVKSDPDEVNALIHGRGT